MKTESKNFLASKEVILALLALLNWKLNKEGMPSIEPETAYPTIIGLMTFVRVFFTKSALRIF